MNINKSMIRLGAAMGAQEAVDACQQLIKENDALTETLADVTAALDNALLHHGHNMPSADRRSRYDLVIQSEMLLAKVQS